MVSWVPDMLGFCGGVRGGGAADATCGGLWAFLEDWVQVKMLLQITVKQMERNKQMYVMKNTVKEGGRGKSTNTIK